jgi:hypothetical protein
MRSDIKNKLEEIEKGLALDPDPTLTIEERIMLSCTSSSIAFAGTTDG